jgi:hypothetical protein
MIQVTGTLVDPSNTEVASTVRITANDSTVTFIGGTAKVEIGIDGLYNFNLVEGTFTIELKINDEYTQPVLVLVNSETSLVVSIPELLVNYAV